MPKKTTVVKSIPGPGIRLLAFLALYLCLVWIPRDEWPRFLFLLLLAAVLVPAGLQAWKRSARMLLLSLPLMVILGVMIWMFGTLDDTQRGLVFADLLARTIVAICAAAMVWGGAGMREFLAGLQQLRAPGIVTSVVTLALQSVIRLGRDARHTLNAVRSRSGRRLSRRSRFALVAPLTRHFLLEVVEFHFHQHAALVSRGHAGGPLRLSRPAMVRREWLFMPVFTVAVLVVAVA